MLRPELVVLVVAGEPETARAPDCVAPELRQPVDVRLRQAPVAAAASCAEPLARAVVCHRPPRRANPPLRPLAPEAIARASCRRTRLPCRASVSAAETPVMPPPTISTSAASRRGAETAASERPSKARTSRPRGDASWQPIDPVLLGDDSRELELRQHGRQLARREPGRARELVRAGRALPDLLEHAAAVSPSSGAPAPAATSPKLSSTSSARVSGVAPSRSSAFEPAESADVISPGTAKTSRPSSRAKSAVISAPLRSRASTTTVAAQRPATIRLRAGKAPRRRLDAGRVLRDDEPGRGDLPRELAVRSGIVAVDPAAEHRDRRPAALERAAVRLGVDAAGEAADDDEPRRRELAAEPARDLAPVRQSRRARRRSRPPAARAARAPPRRAGRAPAADRGSRAGAAGSRDRSGPGSGTRARAAAPARPPRRRRP